MTRDPNTLYQRPITPALVLGVTLPTVVMTVIQSSYSMIDGIFIANLLGEGALSALTLISPYFNFFIAIAALFASGGSAIVMRKMGEGREGEARQDFSMLLLSNLVLGLVLTGVFLLFTRPLTALFGASPAVTALCREYLFAYSFFILPQLLFSNLQMYTIASGFSGRAMGSALLGGVVNLLLDALLIGGLGWGMTGAAVASGAGMLVPCALLAAGFGRRDRMLHLVRPVFRLRVLVKTAANGFSEFSSNLVSGVVMLLFNARMLHYAGENGVAASTITFYVFGLMSAVYMGYMFGISPMLSFFFGSGAREKLRTIRRISLAVIALVAAATTALSIWGSPVLVGIFAPAGSESYALALHGNRLFSLALLLVGFNTFASMLFTSLSNGAVSAVISFARTFIFLVGAILLLPVVFGLDGLWLAVPLSEALALFLSAGFFFRYRNLYGY